MKALWVSVNAQAGWVFLVGVVLVTLWNGYRWRYDRALALRLRGKQPESVSLRAWPKVSVLVAAWNEAHMIREHIESFLRLRYPNKELILCAGGDDGTYETARQYAGERVVVLEQRPGERKQRALQHCLEQAMGEVIFLTDADCLLSDEAFERTVAPVVNNEQAVVTGRYRPLPRQLGQPFVLHRWFTDLYAQARLHEYANGVLGRNMALKANVLRGIGGFNAHVETGIDYHLGKRIVAHGYRIRYVPDSIVKTPYPEDLASYQRQQTRWLRNVVMHGLQFSAYGEVVQCLIPAAIGALMLTGPLLGLCLGQIALVVGWLLAWVHVLLSRVRYMRFGQLLTTKSFKTGDYLRLPAYAIVDFGIWAVTLLQYPFKEWRTRW